MTEIQILPPEEAKKIAAGEVIDRPSALVREFMDNALDASAASIEVSVEGGGIVRTEVSDDGRGMSREDLELCTLTHATSKIRSLSDLETAETLGFRGEALAAAAAVSRLEITSSLNGSEAWKLETGPGKKISLEKYARTRGTSVRSLGLFDTIPARKRFLKREGSEAAACRSVFNDKALVFPEKTFRLFRDGELAAYLEPDSAFKERFGKIILHKGEEKYLYETTAQGDGFRVILVFGRPELFRTDKRQQFVFANGRRIQDYSLLQALEYGLRGWFPGNNHPVGEVIINIDPGRADFNIHPAKKEVRFADAGAIHHSITSTLENFSRRTFAGFTGSGAVLQNDDPPENEPDLPIEAVYSLAAAERLQTYKVPPVRREGYSFLGRLFNLFILVEHRDRLFIIDQHAAHERILYNRFMCTGIPKQDLLIPIPFSAENIEDDNFLKTNQKELENLGIVLKEDEGHWQIEALPADWRLSDSETVNEILGLKNAGKNLAEHWAASLSCHKAVKDNDFLDDDSAFALAEEALNLPDPHCPHGRPIWMEIKKEQILRAVKRL